LLKRQTRNQSKKRKRPKKQGSPTSLKFDFEADGDAGHRTHREEAVDFSFVERLATKTGAEEIQIYSEIRALVKDRYS